jgi:PAS domain S-box-containing protein
MFGQNDYDPGFMKKVLSGEDYQKEVYSEETDRYLKTFFFTPEENYIAALVQDVTLEKREMKARMHLASIVESSRDAIFSQSPGGKILSWNKGAERLYGYSEKEALGSESSRIYDDAHVKAESEMTENVLKGKPMIGKESVHRRKDGSLFPVAETKSPIRDDNGKVIAVSNIIQDITRLKEREKELMKARDETEKAAHLKTMFLENMSHEIRTPLNSILGFADMLRHEVKGERHERFVENINNSGTQLMHLIGDIVDISRLDAGELTVHMTEVNIGRLMEKIRDEFEGFQTGDNENIDFRISMPEGAHDLHLVTDFHRLQQILHNLISNAFKYTGKGYVELGFEFHGKKEVLFYVSDTGPGIDKKYHQVIFERFRQGDEIMQKSGSVVKGTGLGLAIARGLTERLGGKMWVESEPGRGSKFCFTLPLKKGKAKSESSSGRSGKTDPTPRLEGKRIIIAEDDPFSLEMITHLLKETGVTIFAAEDGNKALEVFRKEPVDLILLDIRMPGKNGFEVVREIREVNPHVPVIAQTAYAMPDQIRKIEDAGFDEYLIKPLDREKLYAMLAKYLLQD